MALVLRSICNSYIYYFNELKDPRVEQYPLLGSPVPVLLILCGYLYYVRSLGPRLMANKKPFELNNVMMIYNLVQVILNLSLGISAYYHSYYQDYFKFNCQPLNLSTSENALREIRFTYYYFLLKIFDMLDTVFFVLRRKNSHISFLHVYHHTCMVFVGYIASKFIPGGHGSLLGIINCFVHAFMYSYYFLTSFKPELKQSIWWKKHITQIQMLQFSILLVHFLRPIINPTCDYPRALCACGFIQNMFMLILFADFYRKAYLKKKTS